MSDLDKTKPKIRLILLDADGVIQQPSSEWIPLVELVCGNPARTDKFLEDFYATEAMFMTGNNGVINALEGLLGTWDSHCSFDEAIQLWYCIDKNHDILKIIKAIRASGISVALASNQQCERARYMSRDLEYDEDFDQCFYSCDLGYAKPDAEFFESILRKSGVSKTEVLFIDDRQGNVDSAKSLGIYAERFHISEGIVAFVNLLERYKVYTPN